LTNGRSKPLVAHVITRLIVGGAQLTVLETCAGLRAHFDSHVLCGPEQGPEGTIKPRFDGVAPVTVLSDLRREVSPFADYRAISALRREFRRIEPDVVHTHSSKAGILARQAAASEGLAAVHSIHGWGHTPNDSWIKRLLFIRLERRAARHSRALIAVSKDVLEDGLRYGIGSPDQYRVIPECVDYRPSAPDFHTARRAARSELGVEPPAVVVGWVGRFVPQKDPDTLASALGLVLLPPSDVVAVLVGDGPLRERVRRRLEELGVGDRVVWAGLRPDARSLYPAFDVVLHPSLWEGQPRVVQEAIAERVPVVATAAAGVTDVVEEGSTGYVVPPGDAEALAERTLAVLRSNVPTPLPEDRVARLRERLGLHVALDGHETLYRDLLG
jgi:glycosyltransferase involved in cell wall biosynthesis